MLGQNFGRKGKICVDIQLASFIVLVEAAVFNCVFGGVDEAMLCGIVAPGVVTVDADQGLV